MEISPYPIVVLAYFVFLIVQYVFNALASSGPDGTIFNSSTGDLSDKFNTGITPAGWTFSIWGFIYTWQALWSVYSVVNIFRKGPKGPVYKDPQFLPYSMFVLCAIVCCLNVTWLITFDKEELIVANVALFLYVIAQFAALGVSYVALDKASAELVEQNRKVDIWLTRGLVHNALAMQGTWVTIASLLNLVMVLIYRADSAVNMNTAGTIALSILGAIIAVFSFTDLVFMDRYSRYTITPYIVLVVGLSGSMAKNYTAGVVNSTLTLVLLSVSGALLLVKIMLTLYRHVTRQRITYQSTISNEKGQLA